MVDLEIYFFIFPPRHGKIDSRNKNWYNEEDI
jgi:hypothetical protein